MSDAPEPSYYEIALTNRQVLVSFVVLLSCVLAAFASGVWLGRKGSTPATPGEDQIAAAETGAGDLEELEEFKFFSEQEQAAENAGTGGQKPPATKPGSGTTLAQDVGTSPPPSVPPPSAPPPPSRQASPPPPSSPPPRQPAPPPPSPPPPAASAVASPQEGFVIQVLSTRDEARAKRVLNQLLQGGYPAFLSPVQVGSQVNHRVRIGPYPERPPAEKAGQAVNNKYKLDTWITAASN